MHYYIKKEGYIPTFYKGITMNLIKVTNELLLENNKAYSYLLTFFFGLF